MRKKSGDILYNGLAADVFEDVNSPDTPAPSGHWMNEKIYIYDALSDASEKEIHMMINYLFYWLLIDVLYPEMYQSILNYYLSK